MHPKHTGYTLFEFLIVVGLISMLTGVTYSSVHARRHAHIIEYTGLQGQDVLTALERFYYSYCTDPSEAPALSISTLIDHGFLPSTFSVDTKLIASGPSLSVSFTNPILVRIGYTMGSPGEASALQKSFGTGTVAGNQLTVSRIPRLYDLKMSAERSRFFELFGQSKCLY